jgi:hypothetical protein
MTHKTKVQIANWICTAIVVYLALSARHLPDKAQRLEMYAVAGVLALGHILALSSWERKYQRKSRSFSEHP